MMHMSSAFTHTQWNPSVSNYPSLATQFAVMPRKEKLDLNCNECMKMSRRMAVAPSSVTDDSKKTVSNEKSAKGSGTSARERRLLKVGDEKRKREYDQIHTYPAWPKVLENGCKHDAELRAVLGDSIGNPELMKKRVEERVRQKGPDFHNFNPVDSYIWFELHGSPTDKDVDLIGGVIQSWYVMGRLGAFNSSNLQARQLANSSMEYDPLYDADKGFNVLPSSFHDIGDGQVLSGIVLLYGVDLGTCDFFCMDVLLNCLAVLSSEHLGIQQVIFGGRKMGDWEEGMTNAGYGYKSYKS